MEASVEILAEKVHAHLQKYEHGIALVETNGGENTDMYMDGENTAYHVALLEIPYQDLVKEMENYVRERTLPSKVDEVLAEEEINGKNICSIGDEPGLHKIIKDAMLQYTSNTTQNPQLNLGIDMIE